MDGHLDGIVELARAEVRRRFAAVEDVPVDILPRERVAEERATAGDAMIEYSGVTTPPQQVSQL